MDFGLIKINARKKVAEWSIVVRKKARNKIKSQILFILMIFIIIISLFQIGSVVYIFENDSEKNYNISLSVFESVGYNLEQYFGSLDNAHSKIAYSVATQDYLLTENKRDEYQNIQDIADMFSIFADYDTSIQGGFIINEQGDFIECYRSGTYEMITIINLLEEMSEKGDIYEKNLYLLEDDNNSDTPLFLYINPVYDITGTSQFRQIIGATLFVCDIISTEELFLDISSNEYLSIDIRDGDNTIYKSTSNANVQSTQIFEKQISTTSWTLNGYYIQHFNSSANVTTFIILIVNLICVLIVIFYMSYCLRDILVKPIEEISYQLLDEDAKRNKRRIVCSANNEIGQIAQNINTMLDEMYAMNRQIFNSQSRLYENEILKNEAQIRSLQSQINPHFLCNTLQCVRGIAIKSHVPEIAEISTCMAEIFRYSIGNDDLVPIAEEIKVLKKYLSIINIRYNGKIMSEIRIADNVDIEKTTIPKMTFQPMVENAVNHGLETSLKEKKLIVSINISEDIVVITVEDNGVGIDKERLEYLSNALKNNLPISSTQHTSIGISNINSKLKLLYGDEYGLIIHSTEGEGTRITLRLPQKSDKNTFPS